MRIGKKIFINSVHANQNEFRSFLQLKAQTKLSLKQIRTILTTIFHSSTTLMQPITNPASNTQTQFCDFLHLLHEDCLGSIRCRIFRLLPDNLIMLFPNGADDKALLLPNPQGAEPEDGRAGTEEAGAMLGRQPYTIKANNKMKVKAVHLFTVACMGHSRFLLLCNTHTGKEYNCELSCI